MSKENLQDDLKANLKENSKENSKENIIITNGTTLHLQENENLLDVLLETGHRVEYQCKKGFCGSCRLKKKAGEVDYKEIPLAYIADDEILPCCATPKTNLRLDVDLRDDIQKPSVA